MPAFIQTIQELYSESETGEVSSGNDAGDDDEVK